MASILLLLAFVALPALAAVPRIGVATMQPGEIFFERFGHNAIVVVDPDTGDAISYNFGFFDPTEKDFVGRFVRGDMRYRLAALPFDQDLMQYREEGRGVSIQWLDLRDEEAVELAAALAENAKPENAFYKYEYFDDNCSTRVRDALDRVLDGGLRRQIEGRSHGSTARSEAVRLASPAWWMWLGFDIGLGPSADQPMPVWRESYVPMRLAAALREVKNTDRRPLVLQEQQILPHRLAPEPQDGPVRWWPWALAGVAIGIVVAMLGRARPRVVAAIALPFWILAGVLGALMLFLWFGTQHTYAWANANLLLLSPLCWLLIPGAVRALRGRDPGRIFRGVLAVIALGAVVSLFVYWLPVAPQRNVHWIALLLPIHLGLLQAFRARR
ncbi:DUF4105 domain-containing protein [Lysobacter sp. UC]|uniref:DUF4105 domain-containing protein n=1 Tax=Lysobacter arvi TaxID=3038776 RepID=A0ABU1CDC0_9GAMM|nr:DUF4105 domain-containing protein [Lysobacter arvi]MDR0183178.1 DUF4105 domain-containing protein [Lysobacter arvi]